MDIYQYDDFRMFLRDCYEEKKRIDSSFSYRKFAQAAEIKNPGYLLDVIKGKRSLGERLLRKVVEIFGLKPAEGEFLALLTEYGQCRDAERRQSIYRDILNRRNHSNFVRLNPAQTRYFDDTLYPLLLAAVQAIDFRGDCDALSLFLDPPVPPGKVKKAIRDLCEWELLKQEGDGRYLPAEKFLEPPPTMGSLVRRMNREWIMQAPEALMRHSATNRHMSTVILSVSQAMRKRIQEKLERFRREIFDMVKSDGESEQVMQLSLLYFPKTRSTRRTASVQVEPKAAVESGPEADSELGIAEEDSL